MTTVAQTWTFYEFFAGAGLVRRALAPRWTCVWANDIDSRKQAVYEANFGSLEFHLGDVADVKSDDLPPGAAMAWASFPCQDLSLAGWRRGMGAKRSGTFWAFWGLMQDLLDKNDRPPLLVIENVAGLLYEQNFVGLCEALAALGMQFGALVVDARHFVPQSRPRVFVVAVDARVDCTPSVSDDEVSPWRPKALHEARASLPPSLLPLWRWWSLPTPEHIVPPASALIEDNPTGVEWHAPAETRRMLAMMTDRNLAKVEAAQRTGAREVGFLYKRIRSGVQRAEVRFDGVAGCIRTPEGGSSRQTVLIVEGEHIRSRLLSPREAARFMGVEDDFNLVGNYNDMYRAMGDGVAVPVVSWLAEHLLTPLAIACADTEGALRGRATIKLPNLSRRTAETFAARWKTVRG